MKTNYREYPDERCENCRYFKVKWSIKACYEDSSHLPSIPSGSSESKGLKIQKAWIRLHEVKPNGICDDYSRNLD